MREDQKAKKFGVTDHSATAPFLKGLVSDNVLRILPAAYSPNALTLTGGFMALLSVIILWTFMDEMIAGSILGKTLMVSSAALLIVYAVFDQLDGMQARKTGRSSPFGDFLDHWVDTIIANSMTLPYMIMLKVPVPLIWLMAFTVALAFWAHNWETRNNNYRHLPLVGGLESIWTALIITILTCLFGFDVWEQQWMGLSLLTVLYWFGWSALAWVVIKSLRTTRVRVADYLGFIMALLPISAWLILRGPALLDDFFIVCVGYVALGFMATFLTGNLMRHLWLGGVYRRYDIWTPVLGVIMLLAALYSSSSSAGALSQLELATVSVVCAAAIIRVIHQGISSYRELITTGPASA
jgi:phosphatidylglycerophosphate synthase